MKKTYITPEMETIKIENPAILAGSDPVFGGGSSGQGDSRMFEDLEDLGNFDDLEKILF